MPLPDEIRAMKIAPLGNFHDETENLPTFYQGYQEKTKEDFETLIGNTIEAIPNGSNKVFVGNDVFVYFDSMKHVVMKNNGQSYKFHAMYQSSGKGNAVKLDLESPPYNSTLDGLFQLTDPVNKTHVKGVFSTQFSACGMQLALIGGTKDAPEYIVISHLQNRSRLAAITAKLDKRQDEILGVFSIMLPRKESMLDVHYQLENINAKSVVMIRDANLWPDDPIWYGFGMIMCGFIFEGMTLRLAMIPAYSTLFNSTAMVDISRLPVFNSTPVDICNLIANCEPRRITKNTDNKITSYYSHLFLTGGLGDKYFISKLNSISSADLELFYSNYNSEGRTNFIAQTAFSSFKFPMFKYITWQRAFSTKEIIDGITGFVAPDINEVFKDIEVVSQGQPAQVLQGLI
jgi:hypothetical protein